MFHGPLVLGTFAYHLQAIMNAPDSNRYGNPVAGLAVAASAVCTLFLVIVLFYTHCL